MGQRLFHIAKELGVESQVIVRKLRHEDLPPPRDRGDSGRQGGWTPRSPVSVGLREMIREWHATGELLQAAAEPDPAARKGKKSRRSEAGVPAADPETARGESPATYDGSPAGQAMEAVAQIDQEARQKKRAQLETLRDCRSAIVQEIKALHRQISHIDKALEIMDGRPAEVPPGEYTRTRRDLSGLRERMGAWLESRRGEKFGAGALAAEFPDLENTAVSYVLRPLVDAGRLQTDASAGSKRPTYFAP